jgi:hypothetical protein
MKYKLCYFVVYHHLHSQCPGRVDWERRIQHNGLLLVPSQERGYGSERAAVEKENVVGDKQFVVYFCFPNSIMFRYRFTVLSHWTREESMRNWMI